MILVAETSRQTRQKEHTYSLYTSYLSSERLALPSALFYSLDVLSRHKHNQHFLAYVFFSVWYVIAYNRTIRPCHPSHYISLALVLLNGDQ